MPLEPQCLHLLDVSDYHRPWEAQGKLTHEQRSTSSAQSAQGPAPERFLGLLSLLFYSVTHSARAGIPCPLMALPSETPLIPLGIRLELREASVKRFFWFSKGGDCGEERLRMRLRGSPRADRIWPLGWDRSATTLGDGFRSWRREGTAPAPGGGQDELRRLSQAWSLCQPALMVQPELAQ